MVTFRKLSTSGCNSADKGDSSEESGAEDDREKINLASFASGDNCKSILAKDLMNTDCYVPNCLAVMVSPPPPELRWGA